MMAFNAASTRRAISPWGTEVKKRLLDRQMRQDDLVSALRNRGYTIDKAALSNLLYGSGISNRQDEIACISQILDIPYQTEA